MGRSNQTKQTKGLFIYDIVRQTDSTSFIFLIHFLFFPKTALLLMMQSSRSGPRPRPPNWSTPSYIVVFVRNLKLLQLDQRKDWPEINTRTLLPSPQNHRQRIKIIEWALYHLFNIWDPEGAQRVSCFLSTSPPPPHFFFYF